uniref:Uncharacterized protein n=1 Tax=Panagrolaimus sp. ES5 TaxID=591445 RepID=A0AC34FDU5_9BILA
MREMDANTINPWIDEPNYAFSNNPDINDLLNVMIDFRLPFPQTSAGYLKLLEIFIDDRAKNVSDEEKLKHVCEYLRVDYPPERKHLSRGSSPARTCSTAESYITAEETMQENIPETSTQNDDVNNTLNNSFDATPKAVTRWKNSPLRVVANLQVDISDNDEEESDSFNDPMPELDDEEIDLLLPKFTTFLSSPDGKSRKRKTSFSDVSDVSSESDFDDNVSLLSLSNIMGAMTASYENK